MAVSVRINPLLEKELELAAQKQGITKSQFIIQAVERALGRKNPYELMLKIKAEEAVRGRGLRKAFAGQEQPYDADSARAQILAKLHKKHGISGSR
jgi:HicB family